MAPILVAMGAAVTFGAADYSGGRSARTLPALRVTAVGETSSLALFLAVVVVADTSVPDVATMARGGAAGAANAIAQALLYGCLARGPMSVIAPVTAAVSASLPVMIGLVRGEQPSHAGYVGIAAGAVAVVLVGCAVRAGADIHRRITPGTLVAAIAAGAGFGVTFTLYHGMPADAGLWPVVSGRLVAAPLIWTVIAMRRTRSGPPWRASDWRWSGALAVAAGQLDAAGIALYLHATRGAMLSEVAVVASLYPAVTVFLALAIDREPITNLQRVGVVLAGVSLTLISFGATPGIP